MDTAWSRCLQHLETEFDVDDLHTWLKPLHADFDGEGLTLYAPNPFVLEQVQERFLPRIREVVAHYAGGALPISLVLGSRPRGATASDNVVRVESVPDAGPTLPSNLEPAYTFDNFVEGKSNQMGKSAALQAALNPGSRDCNPLLLYGATGLGKTHLMHAAGNLMLRNRPGMRVLYLRSEQFFSAMMKALQERSMEQFKRHFHTVDALLIDDIQFFAGKNATQEEFFHTFNALFDAKQQLILTCDRYPREVENLEPRLKSRLAWGISVAIEPPDFETRAAILSAKARERGVPLPEDVALAVAKRMHSNVRDLEGALNTLSARANFLGRPITTEFAQETLRDLMRVQQQAISLPNIQKAVADYYQLRVADLLGARRTQNLARARQMAMALARELTEHSLPDIGDAFGGRDHTTVLHACRTVHQRMQADGKLREDFDKLTRKLTE